MCLEHAGTYVLLVPGALVSPISREPATGLPSYLAQTVLNAFQTECIYSIVHVHFGCSATHGGCRSFTPFVH